MVELVGELSRMMVEMTLEQESENEVENEDTRGFENNKRRRKESSLE